MPRRKKSKPKIKIVFDTNVLYTSVASELLRDSVKSFINENSRHSDFSIKWYLSNIVVGERRYQMQKKASEFLPQVKKLERLLDHNLNITNEILIDRVNIAIDNQMSSMGISEITLDTNNVNWEMLITRAVDRLPPFDTKENEKGFRDSLIAESFFQLVNNSPSTPAICRIIFVTEDERLTEYLKECTRENKNVQILANLSELESLINTLVSQVKEEFIAEIKYLISGYFFNIKDKAGLFITENISEKIKKLYGEELTSVPNEELFREEGSWFIGGPVFIKKVRQRLYWSTNIKVDSKLYKYEFKTPTGIFVGKPLAVSMFRKTGVQFGYGPTLTGTPTKVEAGTLYTNFEVSWSVNITPTKKLTKPTIDSIKFVSTGKDE